MLRALLAGAMAALLAWGLNGLALRWLGLGAVRVVVPLAEETAKTLLALAFRAPLFWAHALFGAFEAAVDLVRGGRLRLIAGLAALLSHLIFGAVAAWSFGRTGSPLVAIALPGLVHVVWNTAIVSIVTGGSADEP